MFLFKAGLESRHLGRNSNNYKDYQRQKDWNLLGNVQREKLFVSPSSLTTVIMELQGRRADTDHSNDNYLIKEISRLGLKIFVAADLHQMLFGLPSSASFVEEHSNRSLRWLMTTEGIEEKMC